MQFWSFHRKVYLLAYKMIIRFSYWYTMTAVIFCPLFTHVCSVCLPLQRQFFGPEKSAPHRPLRHSWLDPTKHQLWSKNHHHFCGKGVLDEKYPALLPLLLCFSVLMEPPIQQIPKYNLMTGAYQSWLYICLFLVEAGNKPVWLRLFSILHCKCPF